MREPESRPPAVEPTEKGLLALGHIAQRFRLAALPPAFRVLALSEPGIADIASNLDRHLADAGLPERTKLLVAAAAASAVGGRAGTRFFSDAALAAGRAPAEVHDALATAGVIAVFNGYHRFRHQVPEELRPAIAALRAPFSSNTLVRAAIPHTEVEAICIAVSSINNCHHCIATHIAKATALGLTAEQIAEAIRAGAIAAALAHALAAAGE